MEEKVSITSALGLTSREIAKDTTAGVASRVAMLPQQIVGKLARTVKMKEVSRKDKKLKSSRKKMSQKSRRTNR
jgi:hypothetical protein